MSNVKEITDFSFKKELRSDKPTMLVFHAKWCGPCRTLSPIIEKIADKYKDTLIVGKVDIDDAFNTSKEYNIMSVPTVIFIKDFKVVKQIIGVQQETSLKKIIDNII